MRTNEHDGENEDETRRREMCKKESDEAHATANHDQAEYDKQLLALSSGFLAVSLAFIKDVVPVNTAIHLHLLYISFILLGVCVCLVLFSFQYSIYGHHRAKDFWDEREHGKPDAQFPYKIAKRIKVLNWISGVVFAVGVGFTIYFVISNLNGETQMQNARGIANDGQTIKEPSSPNQLQRGSNMKVPPTDSKKPDTTSRNTANNEQSKK